MSNQEREEQLLYEMMPHIATQVRLSLVGIYVAAARLAPAEERARDPELDKNAAMLLQGYFRLLRLANELDAAPLLASSALLPTQNTELVEWVNSLVMEAQPLFELQGVKLSVQCAPAKPRGGGASTASAAGAVAAAGQRAEIHGGGRHGDGDAAMPAPAGADTGGGHRVRHRAGAAGGCVPPVYAAPACGASPSGLGLGLPLARKVAERHGGRLLLDSKVGQGTCVTLALPDQRTDAVLEEPRADYAGGFQPALLELADGLPFHAYRQVHLDE